MLLWARVVFCVSVRTSSPSATLLSILNLIFAKFATLPAVTPLALTFSTLPVVSAALLPP